MEGGDFCMSSIDERVVGMKFDNAQFEQGIKTTLASLDALNKSLKLEGATKGLSDISAAAQNVQLGHIANSVDDIAGHFKAMSVVAITAIANIATKAFDAGYSIVKSLTVDPINAGLQEYQTNINSIQTILSNTRWQHTGLEDVNKALDTLNHYADETIYNFTQMAHNIGTFTAAGVKLDVATEAIKGIANLAAVSGSSADQASMAMYQLSQALATGTVKLIDWNSVVNAGMGGKVFQDALMATARVHHVAIDSMVKDAGSFRATLENGWLTSQILTETLQQFAGDLTKEQLISMGYTNEQADSIIAMGKDAQDAATKVKTISQLLSTLQEAAGSGWTQTWQLIFGDFGEAKDFFTQVNTVMTAMIQSSADARNNMLKDWKELGGRTVLIEAVADAFHAVLDVIKPIKDAFREIFPKTTGQDLYNITVALRDFADFLQLSSENADKVKRTFAGFFAILGIGYDVLKEVVKLIFGLFTSFDLGGSGILDTTASIGDFLVALHKAIEEGQGLQIFFGRLYDVLHAVGMTIGNVTKSIGTLFDGVDFSGAGAGVGEFVSHLVSLNSLTDTITYTWGNIVNIFKKVAAVFLPLASKMADEFKKLSDAVGGLHFDDLTKALNTAGFLTLVNIIRMAIGRNGVSGAISELTNVLGAMQHTLQAATLLEIALAIGVLTVSMNVLSKINPDDVAKALTGIGVMLAELTATLYAVSALPSGGILKVYSAAASMILLAGAIDLLVVGVKQLSGIDVEGLHRGLISVMVLLGSVIATARLMPDNAGLINASLSMILVGTAINILAIAVKNLSQLNTDEMVKGLAAVGALLTELTLFSRLSEANAASAISAIGIVELAAAMLILSKAMEAFGNFSWSEIGKGLTVMAGALLEIAIALDAIPPTAPLSAAGVLILAVSLGFIADAMKKMGDFNWGEIGKGLLTLAGALTLIAAALILIPPTAALSAAGVLIVAVALGYIADAIKKMGSFSWSEIGKGLVTLAGALAIITVALIFMEGAIGGAVALLLVVAALNLFIPVLKTLGTMSWGEIAKGLGALALAFAVLGISAALLSGVIPAMIGLGAALLLIGAGLALAGAGVFLFAAGLTALSVGGAAATAALVATITAIVGLIPMIVKQVGVALLALIDVLVAGVPKIVELLLDILVQLLKGIVRLAPDLEAALKVLITLLLNVLVDAIPKMEQAGLDILVGILKAISAHIHDVVVVGLSIIDNFLRGLADGVPGVVDQAFKTLIAFIDGITAAINANSEELGRAGGDMAIAIIKGLVKGLYGATNEVRKAAVDVAKSAWNAALDFLGIHSPSKKFMEIGQYSAEGMAVGLDNHAYKAVNSAEALGSLALKAMTDSLSQLSDLLGGDIMNLAPTITPVLDLSDVKKNVGSLDTLLTAKPITVDATYSSASSASSGFNDNQQAAQDTTNQGGGDTFNFTQNNTSPKALDAATIYRQTKNQLSSAKGVLPV
jgi:tape measure domain-containing protein